MNLSPIDALILQLLIKSLAFTAMVSLLMLLLSPFLSARSQSAGWRIVITTTLIMPLLVWILPSIPLLERENLTPAVENSVNVFSETPRLALADTSVPETGIIPSSSPSSSAASSPLPSAASSPLPSAASPVASLPPIATATEREPVTWMLWVWLAAALAMMARLVVGHVSAWRLCRSAEQPDSEFTSPTLPESVSVGFSSDSRLPLTCGLFRPKILLPKDSKLWDSETLQAVTLHELSHIKRRDLWFLLLSNIALALYWPNPFIWLAARKLRLADERAADDAVLEQGMDAGGYSRLLYGMATGSAGMGQCPAVQYMARRSTIGLRIRCLLNPRQIRRAPGIAGLSGYALGVICIGCFVGMVTIREVAAAPDEPSAKQNTPVDKSQTPAASTKGERVPENLLINFDDTEDAELFEALYSLPETHEIVTSNIPDYDPGDWLYFVPGGWEKVPKENKLRVLNDFQDKLQQMDDAKNFATRQRLKDWRLLKKQVYVLEVFEGTEGLHTYAAEDPLLSPIYADFIKLRESTSPGFFDKVNIGDNLSSSRSMAYEYEIIERLVDSTEAQRLECFSRLFAKYAKANKAIFYGGLMINYEDTEDVGLFEALYSLPETHEIVTSNIPDYESGQWIGFEFGVWKKVPKENKLSVLTDLQDKLQQMDDEKNYATRQRLAEWRLFKKQVDVLAFLIGLEELHTFAAKDPLLSPIYADFIKRRESISPGFFDKVNIGDTLSTAESTHYKYEIIKRLVDSPEAQRFECISRIFAK